MKTILYVYSTHDRAKQEFKEFIEHNDPNGVVFSYRYSDLTIEANGVQRRFISSNDLDRKVKGYSFDSVFVDEHVKLTEEQNVMIKSRMRVQK